MANEEKPKKRRNRRSKNSKAKTQAKGRKEMAGRAKHCRGEQMRESSMGYTPRRRNLYPKVSATWLTQLAKVEDLGGSTQIHQFYEDHCIDNEYLRVSEEANVSNPTGREWYGKGVFARKNIPKDVLLCPYVGYGRDKPCPRDKDDKRCCYDMRVRDGFYICAKDVRFDSRYLMLVKPSDERKPYDSVQCKRPCPPNYGRYVNTLTREQLKDGKTFNARFQLDQKEENVLLVATRKISEGEEILAYYGDNFGI
jgi:hypothetical protein